MDARSEARTYSFVALSTVAHVAMATAVMVMQIDLPKSQPQDLTQIEILSASSPAAAALSQAPVEAPTSKSALAPEPSVLQPEEIVVAPAPKVKAHSEKVVAAAKTSKATKAAPIEAKALKTEPKEIPAVLPIVENADLDSSSVAEAQTELKEEDIADDLSKVDQEESAKVAAAHAALAEETDQEMKAQEEKLAAIQKANEEETAKQAKADADKRAKEKQALLAAVAAQQAAEKAEAAKQAEMARQQHEQAEKIRQAEAARKAEQARIAAAEEKARQDAAVAAQAAAIAAAGQGNGGNQQQAQAAGQGSGDQVRSLDELRQMPGNPKPSYDSQDRLYKRQGDVAFLAYVSREGSLVQFKMVKSSGHRELDAKTLKAIKGWKFYPGQEGWVEIPYNWNLKGEPQVLPTTLRRRAQVSQN